MTRDEKPGDLSVRMVFSRIMGIGPDAMKVRPRICISDGTSGLTLEIELTPELLTEFLAGGEARASAERVTGFKSLKNWGKFLKVVMKHVPIEPGDYAMTGDPIDPRSLPHVAAMISDIEADGYVCDVPRRNNNRQWVVVGRRYDEQP